MTLVVGEKSEANSQKLDDKNLMIRALFSELITLFLTDSLEGQPLLPKR